MFSDLSNQYSLSLSLKGESSNQQSLTYILSFFPTQDASTSLESSSPSIAANMNSKGSSHGSVKRSSNQERHPPAFVTSSTDHGSLGLPAGGTLSPFHGSHDPFQTINIQKHQDAVTEMFNMLNKDYASRARRKPPINNDIPLEDLDVEP